MIPQSIYYRNLKAQSGRYQLTTVGQSEARVGNRSDTALHRTGEQQSEQ